MGAVNSDLVTDDNALEDIRAQLCQINEIFIRSIKDAGLSDRIWRASAVFVVQGDERRAHSDVVALRAVTRGGDDGMTPVWYHFERDFFNNVARKICNKVRGVTGVIVDVSSKPPSTIEWEIREL